MIPQRYDTNAKAKSAQADPNYSAIVGVLRHYRTHMFGPTSPALVPPAITNDEASVTSEDSRGCAIWGHHGVVEHPKFTPPKIERKKRPRFHEDDPTATVLRDDWTSDK